jgi:RHS repeat-associated protein
VVEYGYFDNGNRAWKRVTEAGQEPVVTCYVHDGVHVIAEYDGEGELRKEYVYSDNIDEVLNIKDGTENFFPHQDGLNSVVAVTDADGERVASYNYEAFGTIKDATGALDNPITYTGRWLESESEDYFYRARYYDINVGRFLKRDPIVFGSKDYNFYRYVGNGSINNRDPIGFISFDTFELNDNCYGVGYSIPITNPYSKAHTHRNKYNMCPNKKPCYEDNVWKDCFGNKWIYEGKPPLHGYKDTFRGIGKFRGSQCSYKDNGKVLITGKYQGTTDYSQPYKDDGTVNPIGVLGHVFEDVIPGLINEKYKDKLTKVLICPRR